MSSKSIPTSLFSDLPWQTLFPISIWAIWTTRNKLVMESKPFLPDDILKKIQSLSIELFIAIPLRTLKWHCNAISVGWNPTPIGFFKLNTDGSARSDLGMAGVGGLTRDHKGSWIGGFSRNIGFTHSLAAELWGLRDGFTLAKNLNIKKIHIELDAKVVTDFVTAQNTNITANHPCNALIFDCSLLIQTFEEVLVCHTYREWNHYVDLLAKEGCSIKENFLLYSHPLSLFCTNY